jgi:hypothetical protein
MRPRFMRTAILCCLVLIAANARAEEQVVVKPAETDELLANPDIGWETFHRTSKEDRNLPGWLPSTIQYARWGWGELEPQPGRLNTAMLDRVLKQSHDAGQKLAFRVMCCSTEVGHPYQPSWLATIGGRELTVPRTAIPDYEGRETLRIPDMDDPAVLGRHLDFIARLGARYDGHADITHVDLGSIGWWGEWHLSYRLPTLETRMKVVKAYLAAFKKTPLLMLIAGGPCLKYACTHGAGWRADCLGDMGGFSKTWCHMCQGYPGWIRGANLLDTWKTAPVAWETCWEMQKWVKEGWSLRYIFNYALACHASAINNKSSPLPVRADVRPELQRFLRRLGYRFVLKELKHPAHVAAGGSLPVAMQWQNIGSAPCYVPYHVAYRLSNARGFSKIFVGRAAVNHWLSGSIEMFTPGFFKLPPDLPPGASNAVDEEISLGGVAAGKYTLSLAIVDASSSPVVRLGIRGRAADGWYPLSAVEVK